MKFCDNMQRWVATLLVFLHTCVVYIVIIWTALELKAVAFKKHSADPVLCV